jgi:hypothetical protein
MAKSKNTLLYLIKEKEEEIDSYQIFDIKDRLGITDNQFVPSPFAVKNYVLEKFTQTIYEYKDIVLLFYFIMQGYEYNLETSDNIYENTYKYYYYLIRNIPYNYSKRIINSIKLLDTYYSYVREYYTKEPSYYHVSLYVDFSRLLIEEDGTEFVDFFGEQIKIIKYKFIELS